MKFWKISPLWYMTGISLVLHTVFLLAVPGLSQTSPPEPPPSAPKITLTPINFSSPVPAAPDPPPSPVKESPAPQPLIPAPPEPPPPSPAEESPAPQPAPVPAAETAPEIPSKTAPGETSEAPSPAGFPAPVSTPSRDPNRQKNLTATYEGIIRQLINERKEYPYQSRRQEQEGTVRIRFVLARDGRLLGEPSLESSSRYPRLNASALEAVKKAAPFPPFPAELEAAQLSFSLALVFSLR